MAGVEIYLFPWLNTNALCRSLTLMIMRRFVTDLSINVRTPNTACYHHILLYHSLQYISKRTEWTCTTSSLTRVYSLGTVHCLSVASITPQLVIRRNIIASHRSKVSFQVFFFFEQKERRARTSFVFVQYLPYRTVLEDTDPSAPRRFADQPCACPKWE